jgi:PIN domain nuclease of toxin-antitoxin system
MNLLLDTQIFIWAFDQPARLPSQFRVPLQDPENRLFLSVASMWEMQIKTQIGKMALPMPVELFVQIHLAGSDIQPLPISARHIWILDQLPLHHRDPFDRLLIAQANADSLTLVSVDSTFASYKVKRL